MDQNQNHDLFKKPDFIEELSEAAKKMINNPRNRKLNARDYISKHERKLEADKAKYIRVMAFMLICCGVSIPAYGQYDQGGDQNVNYDAFGGHVDRFTIMTIANLL